MLQKWQRKFEKGFHRQRGRMETADVNFWESCLISRQGALTRIGGDLPTVNNRERKIFAVKSGLVLEGEQGRFNLSAR
jgi:hypothetical protein